MSQSHTQEIVKVKCLNGNVDAELDSTPWYPGDIVSVDEDPKLYRFQVIECTNHASSLDYLAGV